MVNNTFEGDEGFYRRNKTINELFEDRLDYMILKRIETEEVVDELSDEYTELVRQLNATIEELRPLIDD